MGIEEIRSHISVASKVDLADTVGWNSSEILFRSKAVIGRTDVNVIHIQENATVRPFGNFRQEFPLGQRRMREGQIAGDILNEDLPSEVVLNSPYPFDNMHESFFGVRQR